MSTLSENISEWVFPTIDNKGQDIAIVFCKSTRGHAVKNPTKELEDIQNLYGFDHVKEVLGNGWVKLFATEVTIQPNSNFACMKDNQGRVKPATGSNRGFWFKAVPITPQQRNELFNRKKLHDESKAAESEQRCERDTLQQNKERMADAMYLLLKDILDRKIEECAARVKAAEIVSEIEGVK